MRIVHQGFDGLDLSIRAQIPITLAHELDEAKEEAQKRNAPVPMPSPVGYLMVNQSGAKGGYSYSCVQKETGNWFFKKPNPSDPWGIGFSDASQALLVNGLEGLRELIIDTCTKLGITVIPEAYSISRVDFAVDFLAPHFTLNSGNVVAHSRASVKTNADLAQYTTNGNSSRLTSITIGKMPGRQAIIYDKRAEVMKRCKAEWPLVWARALHGPDAPPLDLTERGSSQIWRIEIRAGKKCLKDQWFIEGWSSLYDQLPKLFSTLLKDIRYCLPNDDKNRGRWPIHPKWSKVQEIVDQELFEFVPRLAPEEYREVKASQKCDELLTQAFGLIVSAGAIDGINESKLPDFAKTAVKRFVVEANESQRPTSTRLAEASARYSHLVP